MSSADIGAVWDIIILGLVVFAVFWGYAKIAKKQQPALFATKAAGICIGVLVVVSAVVLWVTPATTPNEIEHAGESSDGVDRLDI